MRGNRPLYVRLEGLIFECWRPLFPGRWLGPEDAVVCMANELAALRAEKQSWVDAAAKLQRLRETDPDYARVMYESGLSGDDGGAD
jgi:hypothetical protein